MYDDRVARSAEQSTRRNGADAASMTIDELARRSGMTVRNIRAHQSRGLVPPPEVEGEPGTTEPSTWSGSS